MKHTQLMFLHLDSLIIEPSFTDAMDDTPYVFEFHGTDNPMDADDPETALRQYYNQVRSY
jgi:hypothetical protein